VETFGEFHLTPPESKCLYCGEYFETTFMDHIETDRHKQNRGER
jgi:hypothetical protein